MQELYEHYFYAYCNASGRGGDGGCQNKSEDQVTCNFSRRQWDEECESDLVGCEASEALNDGETFYDFGNFDYSECDVTRRCNLPDNGGTFDG